MFVAARELEDNTREDNKFYSNEERETFSILTIISGKRPFILNFYSSLRLS